MPEKFNPAPIDKHADDPKQAAKRDERQQELDKDLEGTFPASDPISVSQPSKPRTNAG